MKLFSILFFLIFNSIFWSLINSVKNNKTQNELTRVEETSKDLDKILNDGAGSSVAPQIEKYRETLKTNTKITKKHKTENNEEEKRLKQKEYLKDYYQQHKKEKQEHSRNYYQNNKEKMLQYRKDLYQKNRDRVVQSKRKYRQDNKEKTREYKRKYYLKKKKELETLQKDRAESGNIQAENNEGTSFGTPQNDDFINETMGNNEDKKKLAKKEYNKNHYQKKKEKIKESYLKRKNEKENLQNDNYINKGKSPIECNENVQLNNKEGNENAEGTSFVNSQTDDCVNNLSDTSAFSYGQPNIQPADGLHTLQMDDHDDLIDLSLLDDSDFLDYLNSFDNS